MSETKLRAMASVYLAGDGDISWNVTQTPPEVREVVEKGRSDDVAFVELTLGNNDPWNGRSIYVDPNQVAAISPPKAMPDGSED